MTLEADELMAKNAAATSWGAAVGARSERIKEIDRELARLAAQPMGDECCDLAATEPCADCPFPASAEAVANQRGLTDLERELLSAAEAGLNYLTNTESELGITLPSADCLREAIAKAKSCSFECCKGLAPLAECGCHLASTQPAPAEDAAVADMPAYLFPIKASRKHRFINDAHNCIIAELAERPDRVQWAEYLARRPAKAVDVEAALQVLERECLSLKCEDSPTGAGDADVVWSVVSHHMSKPQERVLAFGTTPQEAILALLRDSNASSDEGGR